MPPPQRALCICKWKCSKLTYTDKLGVTRMGAWIPLNTRTNHRKKDIESLRKLCDTSMPGPGPTIANGSSDPTPSNTLAGFDGHVLMERERCEIAVDSNHGTETTAPAGLLELVHLVVCTLAAWLYLVCGLSREAVNRTMKALHILVYMSYKLGQLSAVAGLQNNQYHHFLPFPRNLPSDVRTAIGQLSLEPKLIRAVCCPKCFKQYTLATLPQECDFRTTSRSHVCGEPLWTTRNTRASPCMVPRRLYTTQIGIDTGQS